MPVVFFDPGLEFPETYRYLEVLRERLGLQLHGIRARHTTLDVLAASGAWDHTAASHPVPDLDAAPPPQVRLTRPGPGWSTAREWISTTVRACRESANC